MTKSEMRKLGLIPQSDEYVSPDYWFPGKTLDELREEHEERERILLERAKKQRSLFSVFTNFIHGKPK